jgi:hypothetical protein
MERDVIYENTALLHQLLDVTKEATYQRTQMSITSSEYRNRFRTFPSVPLMTHWRKSNNARIVISA